MGRHDGYSDGATMSVKAITPEEIVAGAKALRAHVYMNTGQGPREWDDLPKQVQAEWFAQSMAVLVAAERHRKRHLWRSPDQALAKSPDPGCA